MNLVITKSNIAVAVGLSVLAHLFFMTIVTVVTPEDLFKTQPFTRVTFLGPILEKTAFDIMVGGQDSAPAGGGMLVPDDLAKGDLSVSLPEHELGFGRSPHYEGREMSGRVKNYIAGEKSSPGMFFRSGYGLGAFSSSSTTKSLVEMYGGRTVIFRPSPPAVINDSASGKEYYKVKVSAIVSSSGDVISARVTRTSGYLFADTEAMKYLEAWKFQPIENDAENVPIETEITVYSVTGGADRDKT